MLKPKLAANILLFSIFGFFLVFILWASLAELDEVTRATGRIVPSKQIQVIQNLEGGIVKEIFVKQGDRVSAGDVLVRLDSTQFGGDFNKNEEEYFSLVALIARLQAESNFTDPKFDVKFQNAHENLINRELNLFNARRAEFDASINALKAKLKQMEQSEISSKISLISAESASTLASAEVEILAPLVERGIESKLELIRAKQRETQANGDYKECKGIREVANIKFNKSIEELTTDELIEIYVLFDSGSQFYQANEKKYQFRLEIFKNSLDRYRSGSLSVVK